jgi:hypothetical protein
MEVEEILHQVEETLISRDAERLVSLYAPDYLFEDTASGERITDRAELNSYFEQLFSLPGVQFSDVRFFALGERGAGQWTWSGRSKASGEYYAIRGASLFKLAEDGMREEIIFNDPRPLYRDAGLISTHLLLS